MTGSMNLHNITAIRVEYDRHGDTGTVWTNLTLVGADGREFRVSAFPALHGTHVSVELPAPTPAEGMA